MIDEEHRRNHLIHAAAFARLQLVSESSRERCNCLMLTYILKPVAIGFNLVERSLAPNIRQVLH